MRHINFKKLILVLGIIIVLNLFINYGVATFYDAPEYENFCPKELTAKKHNTKEECETAGGFWSENYVYPRTEIQVPKEEVEEGWCDVYHSCQKVFDEARDFYNRNVFIILITAGIISIVIGFLIIQAEAVSLGLSFGGLLSLIIGTIRYWSAMNDYLRFIILGIALIILIWIGIKKIKD
ncbi:MAG TPA: hypothetical protein ENH26_00770 [Candidatus Wolfebacteria bacterium]|nr:hypothetical protein [Candidatus Wolfebacteria bacterium]